MYTSIKSKTMHGEKVNETQDITWHPTPPSIIGQQTWAELL